MRVEPLWADGPGLLHLGQTDSTNAEAARLAAAGTPGPLWILADEQTAGRGRRARPWYSTGRDLMATLLLRPSGTAAQVATLSFVAALAVAELALTLAPKADVALKWPNDVLLQGRKLAGILLEAEGRSDGGGVNWLAIGIGVNLVSAPQTDGWPAAAMGDVVIPPDNLTALRLLAQGFDLHYQRWRTEGFARTRRDWLARATRLGETIEARLPTHSLTGVFTGLDADGALILSSETQTHHIAAADIFFPGAGHAAGH